MSLRSESSPHLFLGAPSVVFRNRILVFCLVVLTTSFLVADLAFANRDADGRENEEADWLPSASFSFGVHSQSISGETYANGTQFERGSGDSLITEYFDFGGKLHTPIKFDTTVPMRIFLSAGVQIPLADKLIGERIDESFDRFLDDNVTPDPDFAANCPDTIPSDDPANPGTTDTCALKVRNRVSIDAMWYAGIGIDFTLPVAENQFHIQPSIDYYGLAIQSVGELERSSSGSFLDDFVEQANAVGNAKVFHGISPTLALSVDVFEEGPWRWSMFMQGRAVFLLNDPRVTSSSVLDANSVVFKAGIDDLILQVQGGFQVQWTGLK